MTVPEITELVTALTTLLTVLGHAVISYRRNEKSVQALDTLKSATTETAAQVATIAPQLVKQAGDIAELTGTFRAINPPPNTTRPR